MSIGPRDKPYPVIVHINNDGKPVRLAESNTLFVSNLSATTIIGTNWSGIPESITYLSSLKDVASSLNLNPGYVLTWSGSKWVASSLPTQLNLNLTNPKTGDALVYVSAGNKWINAKVYAEAPADTVDRLAKVGVDGTVAYTEISPNDITLTSTLNNYQTTSQYLTQYSILPSSTFTTTAILVNYTTTGYNVTSFAGTSVFETTGYARTNYFLKGASVTSLAGTSTFATTGYNVTSLAGTSTFATTASLTNYAFTSSLSAYETTGYARTNYFLKGASVTSLAGTSTFATTGYNVTSFAGTSTFVTTIYNATSLAGTSTFATTASLTNYAFTSSLSAYETTGYARTNYFLKGASVTSLAGTSTFATTASLVDYAFTSSLSAYETTGYARTNYFLKGASVTSLAGTSTFATTGYNVTSLAGTSTFATTGYNVTSLAGTSTFATTASLVDYAFTSSLSAYETTGYARTNYFLKGASVTSLAGTSTFATTGYNVTSLAGTSTFATTASLVDYAFTSSLSAYETTGYARTNYFLKGASVTSLAGTSTFATTASLVDYVLTSTNYELSSLVNSHIISSVHWDLSTLNTNYINSSGDSVNGSFYFQNLSGSIISATTYLNLPTGVTTLSSLIDVSVVNPSANQSLIWDGSYWTPSSISMSPGGSNTQIQFNNNGVFSGSPALTWSSTTSSLNSTNYYVGSAIQFNTSITPTLAVGQIAWNSTDQTLDIQTTLDTTLQVGQEQVILVENKSGATIDNGMVVYVSGTIGGSGKLNVALASASSVNSETAFIVGVTTQTIADGGMGFVTTFGKVNGIPLPTVEFSDGDIVYLGDTPGKLRNYKPSKPSHGYFQMGRVVRAHNSNGILFVTIRGSVDMDEIHNVASSTPENGQILVYNTASSMYIPNNINAISGITNYATTGYNVTSFAGTSTFATTNYNVTSLAGTSTYITTTFNATSLNNIGVYETTGYARTNYFLKGASVTSLAGTSTFATNVSSLSDVQITSTVTNGQVLAWSSTRWVPSSVGGGGGGTPGGSNTFVQFNNNGTFSGVSDFIYDKSTSTVYAINVSASNYYNVSPSLAGPLYGVMFATVNGFISS